MIILQEEGNYYRTSNSEIACWLASKGRDYTTKIENESTVVFYFEDSMTLRGQVQDFISNKEIQAFLFTKKFIMNDIRKTLGDKAKIRTI